MKALRYRPLVLPLASLVLAIATSGCGKGAAPSAPTPSPGAAPMSQQAADDIASQFAITLSRQGGVPLTGLGATSLTAMARGEVSPARLGPSGSLKTEDEGNFNLSVSLTFYDAAGNVQPIYDPATTARVVARVKVRGTLTTAERHALIGSDRTLDVAGLLPAETTIEIDGSARDTADCAFNAIDGSASRHYRLVGAGDLTDIRKLKDESVNPYPLSGTARWAVTADATVTDASGTQEAHYEATVLVTFNGTQYPTIEVSEGFRYRMDLETGAIERLPA